MQIIFKCDPRVEKHQYRVFQRKSRLAYPTKDLVKLIEVLQFRILLTPTSEAQYYRE